MGWSIPFGSNTEGDDFLDVFAFLEIGGLLHGDFAEGVDVHARVGEVDCVVLDFDLRGRESTFWEE
jgi:hypothetical protein